MSRRIAFHDDEAERLLAPLVDRGRAKFAKFVESLPPDRKVIGFASLSIVLRADYVKHADILLRHVIFNRGSIYIMLEDARLVALLCPFGPE